MLNNVQLVENLYKVHLTYFFLNNNKIKIKIRNEEKKKKRDKNCWMPRPDVLLLTAGWSAFYAGPQVLLTILICHFSNVIMYSDFFTNFYME